MAFVVQMTLRISTSQFRKGTNSDHAAHHMRIVAGHTRSRGRCCHSFISATTFSVILLIASFDTLAPYTSAKCAAISPVGNPRAANDSTS